MHHSFGGAKGGNHGIQLDFAWRKAAVSVGNYCGAKRENCCIQAEFLWCKKGKLQQTRGILVAQRKNLQYTRAILVTQRRKLRYTWEILFVQRRKSAVRRGNSRGAKGENCGIRGRFSWCKDGKLRYTGKNLVRAGGVKVPKGECTGGILLMQRA